MADTLKFKKGTESSLPAASNGQILFTTDTNKFYIDDDNSHKLVAGNAVVDITRSGKTFTMTKLDGTTDTFTQQDNNTTYSAGDGLSLSGTTFSHANTSSQASLTAANRRYVKSLTLDEYGHVTALTTGTETVTDTNTTYSAGAGISLSGTTFSNSGVRSVATGGTNGTISVNTNGTAANVAVKGLAAAAYRGVKGLTAKGDLGWGTNNNYIADISMLTYWNGAYNGTASNLSYCNQGAFGSIVTKGTDDYVPIRPNQIEFGTSSSAGHGGYLDFHYNGSSSDYTSRIIESASGTLSLNNVTIKGSTITGSLSGNASTASKLAPHSGVTTNDSSWDGAAETASSTVIAWRQAFKNSNLGSDSGDLVLKLRAGQYSSGGTELCMMIDGDYYSMGNKVLHAGNYASYAAPASHSHSYLPLTGGTLSGALTTLGQDIVLGCASSSSNDSGDISYTYGNGTEKCRIWTANEYTSYCGPNWRVYRADGTPLGSGHLWASGESVMGAVWNDYAECRESDCNEPGYVLSENGDDTLSKSNERLSPFAGVSSDTWGFSQGETEKAKTHIAVAGRVLVYPYQDRNNYKSGDCVCAAPGGTVDIMTHEEVINWPDRIVGTVSCVPEYEEWGGGEGADRTSVKVNGRIWIKVK